MTPITELSPTADEPAAPDARALFDELRELLPPGKKKLDSSISDEVGRKVNLLALQLPKVPDEAEALRCLGLIGVAIACGSKEAAKRKPHPARWVQSRPARLKTLPHPDERAAALDLLAALKADWAAPYAIEQALDPDIDKTLATALLKWAVKASRTQGECLGHLAHALETGQPATSDRIQLVLKSAAKELAATDTESGPSLPQTFLALATSVAQACQTAAPSTKTTAAMQVQTLALLDVISNRDPAVLFEPLITQGLTTLCAELGGWPKTAAKPLAAMARRMLSLSIHHVRLRGLDDVTDVRRLLQHAGSTLPIDKVAVRLSSERELIKQLRAPVQDSPTPDASAANAPASLQEQLGALLVAWDALRSALPDPVAGQEVTALIELAAGKANVERSGARGEIVAFQPLQHYLAEPTSTPPTQVRIDVPGVRAMRSDGSYRLLTRAVVYPIS
jgi:hypothetical protein